MPQIFDAIIVNENASYKRNVIEFPLARPWC